MRLEDGRIGMRVRVVSPTAAYIRGRTGTVIRVDDAPPFPIRLEFEDGHMASVRADELEPAEVQR